MGATARERLASSSPPAQRPPQPWPWPRGPAHPRATDGSVHVWWAELDAAPEEALEVLTARERRRWAGILSAQRGRRWASSRALLRALLGTYLRIDPRAVELLAEPGGRPVLTSDELHFSLSHSGPVALYAITRGSELGVDVERAREGIDQVAFAARALGPDAARRLRALAPAERARGLARLWARCEAELKWRGTGFGGQARGSSPTRAPWLSEFDAGVGLAGAVATATSPRELCCWRWPPVPEPAARGS